MTERTPVNNKKYLRYLSRLVRDRVGAFFLLFSFSLFLSSCIHTCIRRISFSCNTNSVCDRSQQVAQGELNFHGVMGAVRIASTTMFPFSSFIAIRSFDLGLFIFCRSRPLPPSLPPLLSLHDFFSLLSDLGGRASSKGLSSNGNAVIPCA